MGDVYRETTRVYRDRERDDDYGSEDDRYKSTTVRRYKVASNRGSDRMTERVDDDDHRSRISSFDRPRSAFEPSEERRRTNFYEREDSGLSSPKHDNRRITVYEGDTTEVDFDRRSRHHDGHHHHHHGHDHGHEVERYRKETEYYTPASPPPPPVIIRQRQEPQKIIVQEAPQPAPIYLPRQEPNVVVIRDREYREKADNKQVARREPRRDDEESYYYRHERREVGAYRGDRDRDGNWGAMARHDGRRDHHNHHSDDDDYYYRRRVVRRESNGSPHHKRHLAVGALAGAGVTALLSSRRDSDGDLQENRGRKVVAGGALGALGTEALRRAKSAYGDRQRERGESPDDHIGLKRGLGVAAVVLAAAGAAKYYQANKIEKEEAGRGRSRRRSRGGYSNSEVSYSRSRSRTKSRRRSLSTVAKAALGTAATAGIVKHFRSKSKQGSASRGSRSRSRSKSRLRKAAEVGAAAGAAGVATKIWKDRKAKKDRDRDLSADDYSRRGSRSRSRSRSRSHARSVRGDSAADTDLGLIEYGNDPLGPDASRNGERSYESEAEERRRRRRRRRERERSSSSEGGEDGRKRSQSRLRNMASAGAAAFGIKEYQARKDQEKREKESRNGRSRDRSHSRDGRRSPSRDPVRDRSRDRSRRQSGDRNRRRNGEADDYYDQPGRNSPPMASGGAYYPPYPETPEAPGAPPQTGFAPYPNQSTDFHPYMPQDYTGYPMPGPPPGPGYGGPAPPPGGYGGPPGPPPGPPNGGHHPPDHVSDVTQEDGVKDDMRARSKSVSFIPLSPKSSKTMEKHRKAHSEDESSQDGGDSSESASDREILPRRSTGPPTQRGRGRHQRRDVHSPNSEEDIEVLPDRFSPNGQPLNSSAYPGQPQWTSRSGDFERRPNRPGGSNMKAAWQVSGTDPQSVDKTAKGVTNAIDGKVDWLKLAGDILPGLLGDGSGDDEGRRRRRR